MGNTTQISQVRDAALAIANSARNVHDHLKDISTEDLKDLTSKDRLPWHTMCLNCTGDLNVGTMIRTSHCMGAKSVIVYGRQRIDNRSLVGAGVYTPVEKLGLDADLSDPALFCRVLAERNLTPVFVEQGGIDLHRLVWKNRIEAIAGRKQEICLVMGNETGGVPASILEAGLQMPNSFCIAIAQRGVIRSMNVAVAHAMVVSSLVAALSLPG
jgi:tRNA G18 (ribose-2'-O)-methylase SpoU